MQKTPNEKAAAAVIALLILAMLALAFWPRQGSACPETPEPETVSFCGKTYWTAESETRELAGLLYPGEPVKTLPLQDLRGGRIRGYLFDGCAIRVAAKLQIYAAGERLLGVTETHTTVITLRSETLAIVEAIVRRELGEDVELCGGSVSTALLVIGEDGTAAERMAPRSAGGVTVGWAAFNADITDTDVLDIVILDWDGDGELDLCLRAGSAPEEAKAPEAEPEKEEIRGNEGEVRENEGNQGQAKKECWKVEFNLHFLIQHCRKIIGQ
ncbi:MAG: hypothetical protein J5556_07070 [Deltaproteobacteria bacterium]|nr:hypothetical protein [Deltaproteobacteria bacterium]